LNKLKYILLGLLISTSAIAQEADLELPDLGAPDPLLDAPAAAPSPTIAGQVAEPEKKEILDKAIDEVFNEPKAEEKKEEPAQAAPEEVKIEEPVAPAPTPTEEPGVDEAAAPIEEAPKVDDLLAVPDMPATPEAAKEEPAQAAPEVEVKDVVTPVISDAPKVDSPAAPTEKEITIEVGQPEVKQEIPEAPVAPEKFEQPKITAPAAPKKKIVFPKLTPKSLRQDYQLNNFDGGMPAPAVAPANNVPVNNSPVPNNGGWIPVQPNMQPAPTSAPAAPFNGSSFNETPASLKPQQEQAVNKPGSVIDQIQDFPSSENPLTIKEDITIDRGNFNNPFASSVSENAYDETAPDDLADLNNDPNSPNAPVVDFSENGEMEGTTTSGNSENFFLQDAGLEVEVKQAPVNNVQTMNNAYGALKVGQYESAVRYYNEVLELDPNNKKALFGVATAYHMSKQYDKAREAYLKIINIDPKYAPAVNNYIILVTEENPEKAIERLENLYSKNPSFAAIPAQLGNLYYNNGEPQKAVEYYAAAIKLEPRNIEYRYNVAVILEKSGNYSEAASLYKYLLDEAAKGVRLPEDPVVIRDRYYEIISKS
jgi:tetratricopeptide (TPR) repeat protein